MRSGRDWHLPTRVGGDRSLTHTRLFATLTAARPKVTTDWNNPESCRAFFDKIAKRLGIQKREEWHDVPRRKLRDVGGEIVWQHYRSLESALKSAYPHDSWRSDKFLADRLVHGHWRDTSAMRAFFDRIGPELGVKQLQDWYNIKRHQVVIKGGNGLRRYCASLEAALRAAYPEYPWDSSRFSENERVSRNFWRNKSTQRQFLDGLAKKLNILEWTGWYDVDEKVLRKHGARYLVDSYDSRHQMFVTLYPEHPWEIQRFPQASIDWNNKNNLFDAMDKAEKLIGITKPEDWYSITLTELREVGFPVKVGRIRLAELLGEKYPEFNWEKVYLLRGRFAQQKRLERAVRLLFPGVEIQANVRKEADLVAPDTGEIMEVDIFLPSLNLAFEFHERHHYISTNYNYTPLEKIAEKDKVKEEAARAKGLTLIVVPCWWDGTVESLVASIKQIRPDLHLPDMPADSKPIPKETPPNFFRNESYYVDGVGEPTTACFLTNSMADPTNWWLFEKYDGLRAFWNPDKKVFYSRTGKVLPVPQEIADTMPNDLFLDGELWFGRDKFHEALKISHRADLSNQDWSKFKYMVFDVPKQTLGTYEQRYSYLVKNVKANQYLEIAPREICRGTHHFEAFFQDILDQGGEGIILRDPQSPYEPGRSKGFLKHKKYRDAEAKVVSQSGPHQYECELPNGVRFTATPGTTEFVSRWHPKAGDIVGFKYRGLLAGTKKPKLPVLYRMRDDLSWDDVVSNWKEMKPSITVLPSKRPRSTNAPKRHWKSIENRRAFFTKFAEEMGFDPLVPENWYPITKKQVKAKKGGTILKIFPSLASALAATFPEVTWKGFGQSQPRSYWLNINNRELFFREIAAEQGFDPLVAANWASVPRSLVARKGRGLLTPFGNSVKAALEATFPGLKIPAAPKPVVLRPEKKQVEKEDWQNIEKRKQFFLDYAKQKGFDPLSQEDWQKVSKSDIRDFPKGASLLAAYRGSLYDAFRKTFPDFEKEARERVRQQWKDPKRCREYFESFAQRNGFNPLLKSSWSPIHFDSLLSTKEGTAIHGAYGSFRVALQNAFPEGKFV